MSANTGDNNNNSLESFFVVLNHDSEESMELSEVSLQPLVTKVCQGNSRIREHLLSSNKKLKYFSVKATSRGNSDFNLETQNKSSKTQDVYMDSETIDDLNVTIARLEDRLARIYTEKKTFEELTNHLKLDNSKLRSSLANNADQTAQLRTSYTETCLKVEDLNKEKEALQIRLKEEVKQNSELKEINLQVDNCLKYNKKLQQKQQENSDYIEQLKCRNATLQNLLTNQCNKNEALEKRNRDIQAKTEVLENENANLQSSLKKLTKDNSDQINDLKKESKKLLDVTVGYRRKIQELTKFSKDQAHLADNLRKEKEKLLEEHQKGIEKLSKAHELRYAKLAEKNQQLHLMLIDLQKAMSQNNKKLAVKTQQENLKDDPAQFGSGNLETFLKIDLEVTAASQMKSTLYLVSETWFDQHAMHVASDFSDETKPPLDIGSGTLTENESRLKDHIQEGRDFVAISQPAFNRICQYYGIDPQDQSIKSIVKIPLQQYDEQDPHAQIVEKSAAVFTSTCVRPAGLDDEEAYIVTVESVITRSSNSNSSNNDIRPECPFCGRKFFTGNALQLHIDECHNDSRRECPLCGKKFFTDDGLQLHINERHT